MLSFDRSDNLKSTDDYNPEPIYLFQQFFIHKDAERQKEIELCLKKNVENRYIDNVYLLNEKIYKDEELKTTSKKIIQKKIKTRLTYKKLFKYILNRKINGYLVFSNSDIFLDDTINNIKKTEFHKKKNFIGLLRYDYNIKTKKSKIFGPRFDSQDTWIIHTDFLPKKENLDLFNFQFGRPGCDNKLIYIMKILGYKIFNVPKLIKSHHVHTSKNRDYTIKDLVPRPHIYIEPYGFTTKKANIEHYTQALEMTDNLKIFNHGDNVRLYNYICEKNNNNEIFYIPKLCNVECYFTYIIKTIIKNKQPADPEEMKIILKTLADYSFIYYDNPEQTVPYTILYENSIKNCEVYTCYEKYSMLNQGIGPAIDYFQKKYTNKHKIWDRIYNIGENIPYYPWSLSLSGKKILIISQHAEKIAEQGNKSDYYGVKLFPNCKIQCLEFKTERIGEYNSDQIFSIYIENLKNYDFDIALLDVYGYGNILAEYIYNIMKKSSINVGEMLPLYFGLYNQQYAETYPDIMKLYKNDKWKKI
jgi:hypothetical protein